MMECVVRALPRWLDGTEFAEQALPLAGGDLPDRLPGLAYVGCVVAENSLAALGWFLGLVFRAHLPARAGVRLVNRRSYRLAAPNGVGYVCTELALQIETQEQLRWLKFLLPQIADELRLISRLPDYTAYLQALHVYAPKAVVRTAWHSCMKLSDRWPELFGAKLLIGLQHFLLFSSKEFRSIRKAHHIVQMVSTAYYFFRQLTGEAQHLIKVRVWPARLSYPFGCKPVFAVLVALKLNQDKEKFDQSHLLRAVRELLPNVAVVHNSFCLYQTSRHPVRFLYLELEPAEQHQLGATELALLKRELAGECIEHLEQLTQSIFIHRNEEELSRAVLSLSRELRHRGELPQMILSFENQDAHTLSYNVILVRLKIAGGDSIRDILCRLPPGIECQIDALKTVGQLGKRYSKEAVIFRLRLAKAPYLRKDYSVDLYRARHFVGSLVTDLLGHVRDYNGGLILKSDEALRAIKCDLNAEERRSESLLEDLFHGFEPTSRQAQLDPTAVGELFRQLLKLLRNPATGHKGLQYAVFEAEGWILGALQGEEPSFRVPVVKALRTGLSSSETLAISCPNGYKSSCLGFLIRKQEEITEQSVSALLKSTVEAWRGRRFLRLMIPAEPFSLDPRKGANQRSQLLLRMLFEGLTRIGPSNQPELGVAEEISISEDQRVYRFRLRKSHWSNGRPLTARDFEWAWKSLLDPSFESIFTYGLYCLRNAEAAQRGEVALDEVGVKAIDDSTLLVQLAHPVPYFLYLIANPLFAPVCQSVVQADPSWCWEAGESYLSNGPFRLIEWQHGQQLIMGKNPYYWDEATVHLPGVEIEIVGDPEKMIHLFDAGRCDWLGEPLFELQSGLLQSYRARNKLRTVRGVGVYQLKLNVERPPLTSVHMRRALATAIDRKRLICRSTSESAQVATSLVPPALSTGGSTLVDADLDSARSHLVRALEELGCSIDNLPPISLSYATTGDFPQVAAEVKRQWEENLGIRVILESSEWNAHFARMVAGEVHVGGGGWYSWTEDAAYSLEHVKSKYGRYNCSRWEHADYAILLDAADRETDPERRKALLRMAERFVMQELPLIPLFEMVYRYCCCDELQDVFISRVGMVDFKWARLGKGAA